MTKVLNNTFEEAKRILTENPKLKVMVVGGRASNFDPKNWANKQFLFKDNTTGWSKLTVPKNVGVIIKTRFVGHSQEDLIDKQNSSAFVIPGIHGTGIVNSFLREVAALSKGKKMTTISMPVKDITYKHFKRGELQDFLLEYANIDAAIPYQEIERLTYLALEKGYKTTEKSVGIAFRKFKKAVTPQIKEQEEVKIVEVESTKEFKPFDIHKDNIEEYAALLKNTDYAVSYLEHFKEQTFLAIVAIDALLHEFKKGKKQ